MGKRTVAGGGRDGSRMVGGRNHGEGSWSKREDRGRADAGVRGGRWV
jgi:hypothetical protein